jgi:hypothetical protein
MNYRRGMWSTRMPPLAALTGQCILQSVSR